MSRANEETLLTLAVITGCLVQMSSQKCYAEFYGETAITQALKRSLAVGRVWYSLFDDRSTSTKRMTEKIAKWNVWLESYESELSCGGLTSAASRLCTDLEEKLKNRTKKQLVNELKDELVKLEWYATDSGALFDAIEEGNIIIDKLQGLMGWENTNFVKLPTKG